MKKLLLALLLTVFTGICCFGNNANIDELKKRAEAGDAEAQLALGDHYHYGIGVDEDQQKAVHWYTKSAEQGFPRAQEILGYCYYYGIGAERDFQKAAEYYAQAAAKGLDWAQFCLGYCYAFGDGVPRNPAKACYWFTRYRAENAGGIQHEVAYHRFKLGEFYEKGYGVEKDIFQAIHWYRLAATHGNQDAEKALAGIDVPYMSITAYDDDGQKTEYGKSDRIWGLTGRPKSKIEFRRGNKILFSQSCEGGDWGFITWEHGEKQCKTQHHPLCHDQASWQEFLTNPGSNKNRRYLALWHYIEGSRAFNTIYILDTENDFKLIDQKDHQGEFWENYDYTFEPGQCNCRGGKECGWFVTKQESIGTYGGYLGEGRIYVDLKIIPGKKPEFVGVKDAKPDFEKEFFLREHKKSCDECNDKRWGKEIFFSYLYCDMANRGWIELAPDFARKLGFTEEEIKEYGEQILNGIRQSQYYHYLVQLNGREF